MGRQTEAQRQKYIRNYARTLKGQLGINSIDYEPCLWHTNIHQLDAAPCCSRIVAQMLKEGCHVQIDSRLVNQSDEVVCRLAMSAPGRNERKIQTGAMITEHVFGRNQVLEFDTRGTGKIMVYKIALAGVIATMAETIYSDLKKNKQ